MYFNVRHKVHMKHFKTYFSANIAPNRFENKYDPLASLSVFVCTIGLKCMLHLHLYQVIFR